ncbi:MAG TPA: hypothetical protein VI316_08455 [Candidatus Dormibacteraeota bacterium]
MTNDTGAKFLVLPDNFGARFSNLPVGDDRTLRSIDWRVGVYDPQITFESWGTE